MVTSVAHELLRNVEGARCCSGHDGGGGRDASDRGRCCVRTEPLVLDVAAKTYG